MKPRNPDVDFGFFAQIPRMIRTDYKSLTSVQKWLYVCLKDLCGETGTCYRTLRVLADETSISTGMLSESIAALHKEGLIHAEKKKRSIGGKEVWHITIVDIWQANAKAHPTKRSHSEQTIENVHIVNDVVHRMNEDTGVCSCGERVCSLCETEEVSSEVISFNEERTIEEREKVADATARSQSSQEISQDEETVKPSQKDTAHGTSAHPAPSSTAMGNASTPGSGRTERQDTNKVTQPPAPKKPPTNTIPKRPKQPITTPVSPEAQRILDDWVSLFTKKIVINQGDIDAAEHLVPTNITCEEMRQERLWLFSTDNPQKPWYRKIGVCLADIDKKYSQWQSLNEAPKPPPGKDESNEHRATQQPANAFIERCLDKDYNKRKLEEMREKNALKRQAQAAKGVQL